MSWYLFRRLVTPVWMKRGIIGRAGGSFNRIEPLRRTTRDQEEELVDQVDITRVKRTPSGLDINEGIAATQSIKERETAELGLDSIELSAEQEKVTTTTNFLAVPGEFIAVDSKRGKFLFELLSQDLGVDITTSAVNLERLISDYSSATAWKVGYYDPENPTRNGVVHGESILETDEYADRLAGTEMNQLGLHLQHDQQQYKLFVTKSGYVDIYQPSELESADFAQFVTDVILPYLT